MRPVSRLGPAERDEMYRLFRRHFEGVERRTFEADLAGKNWAVLLRDGAGRLNGFTTLHFYESHDGQRPCSVLYSGDTVVAGPARGSSILCRRWLQGVLELRAGGDPARPLYWLLLTSGFRTYRFLPVFWRRFFPRWDRPTPARVQSVLERLAGARFGADFQREEGIVRFPHPQRLRSHLSGIPEGRLSDPHVRFFQHRNPGADRGDELVCLTRIHQDNLTPAGRRVLRSVGAVAR